MSQHYIGRAAEAAARAKHNRIHNVKKTAKKKEAKKVPTKAARAIDEALGALKPAAPANLPQVEHVVDVPIGWESSTKDVECSPDRYEGADADDYEEYGPLGGQDEEALARAIIGEEIPPLIDADRPPKNLNEAEKEFYFQCYRNSKGKNHPDDPSLPEKPVMAQRFLSTPPEETPAQVVPQPTANAPQVPTKAKSKSPVESCILSLIDALNFLHREGHLRKLPEKDILILKHRIKTARQLIEKL